MDKRFQFTVDHMIGRREVELVVTYSVTPFVGATYWQPAEGGEVEIVSVTHAGREVELSDAEMDALADMAQARAPDDWAENEADHADYRLEQQRDRVMMDAWERGA